jgi:hypothetical protein
VRSFKDNAGREWRLSLNVSAARRVRDELSFDLLDVAESVKRLASDPILLCDVIFVLCRDQAAERGVVDEDFGRAMAGDAIEAATDALIAEYVDFCPSPRDRANLRRAMEATKFAQDKARDLVERRLANAERLIEERLARLGDGSGDWPESPESILDP